MYRDLANGNFIIVKDVEISNSCDTQRACKKRKNNFLEEEFFSQWIYSQKLPMKINNSEIIFPTLYIYLTLTFFGNDRGYIRLSS